MSPPASAQSPDRQTLRAASPAGATGADAVHKAFDACAARYDNEFTGSLIGRLQREAVWRCLDGVFPSGSRILDLGCGTGADAIHFAQRGVAVEAVDLSQAMIAETQRKIAAAGLSGSIAASVCAIEDLKTWDRQSCLSTQAHPGKQHESPKRGATEAATEENRQDCLSHARFDGALSNFGALNCVPELRPVAAALGRLIRPGGHLALCLISRFCLWEIVFYGVQGRFAKAARRWSNDGRASGSVGAATQFPVYYRTVREIAGAFRPEFRLEHHYGIGITVPPTYVEIHARRLPQLTKLAAKIDRAIAAWPIAYGAADHTLLVFRREPLS
jgi:SAM-dependent methyltransferase